MVAYPQVLGALQKCEILLSPPCPLAEPEASGRSQPCCSMAPGKRDGEKTWSTTLLTLLYEDIYHSCLLPFTVWPEAKPRYTSIASSSSQTKQHSDLVDTRNVLIYYKLEPHCTDINPGTLPDEWWGTLLTFLSPKPVVSHNAAILQLQVMWCFTLSSAITSVPYLYSLSIQIEMKPIILHSSLNTGPWVDLSPLSLCGWVLSTTLLTSPWFFNYGMWLVSEL